MSLILSRNDGPYETTIFEIRNGPRSLFRWTVVDTRDQRTRTGRSRSEEWARHDAQTALDELRSLLDPDRESAA